MSDFFPIENYPGIFASHQWVDAWEKSWGDYENITLIKKHLDEKNCRDGIYTHQYFRRYFFSLTTAFSAGVSTPASPSLRSEYFTFQKNAAQHFIEAVLQYRWDQFYIPDLIQSSVGYSELCECVSTKKLSLVVRDRSISYAVSLKKGNFESYVQGLSSNTRLKMYNKRKRLYEIGDICIENIWPDINTFIEYLNEFHIQRWGKPCYEYRNRKQITYFLNAMVSGGGEPDLSVIYCNGKPISVALDLMYAGRIYNIQSGYIENFHKGISLGTLHFGFQIEKAFNSGASFYDFMAGNGKNSDYKKSLATHSESLVSVMIVRGFLLRSLYLVKDYIRQLKSKK